MAVQIKDDLPQSVIRQYLDFQPETGLLVWRERPHHMFETNRRCSAWNARYVGKPAGSINSGGYFDIRLFDLLHRAHRLAWIHAVGPIGQLQIDHINGVKTDNRIENLRVVTQLENGKNQRLGVNSTTGICGVCWDKQHKKWRAQIVVQGQRILLGVFTDIEEAASVRREAEKRFGFHPNHGAPRNDYT